MSRKSLRRSFLTKPVGSSSASIRRETRAVPDFKCEMARLYGMGLWYRWHCPKWVRNTILNRIRVETDVAANNVGGHISLDSDAIKDRVADPLRAMPAIPQAHAVQTGHLAFEVRHSPSLPSDRSARRTNRLGEERSSQALPRHRGRTRQRARRSARRPALAACLGPPTTGPSPWVSRAGPTLRPLGRPHPRSRGTAAEAVATDGRALS